MYLYLASSLLIPTCIAPVHTCFNKLCALLPRIAAPIKAPTRHLSLVRLALPYPALPPTCLGPVYYSSCALRLIPPVSPLSRAKQVYAVLIGQLGRACGAGRVFIFPPSWPLQRNSSLPYVVCINRSSIFFASVHRFQSRFSFYIKLTSANLHQQI